MKRVLIFLLAVSFSFSFVACEKIVPEKVASNTTSESESKTQKQVFNIGDTIKAGKGEFTVNGIREYYGSEFLKPKDGKMYYVVDISVENISQDSLNLSSIMMFKLFDSESYSHDVSIVTDLKGSLDAQVSPGNKIRGEIAFEIDKNSSGLKLQIKPSLWGSGDITVKLDR